MTIGEKITKEEEERDWEELPQWKKLYIRAGRAHVCILKKQWKDRLVIQDHS